MPHTTHPTNNPDYPILEPIRQRYSPYAFDRRPVEAGKIRLIMEAARWAMSSYNEQPWAYILAHRDDKENFARILGCLVPGNQGWAKDVPVLGISAVKKNFEKSGKLNRVAMHDVGGASAFLTLQAESQGLKVHQMAGIDLEKCRATLGIPEGWEGAAGLAIGYAGDPAALPDDLRARELAPRTRRPQKEFVFNGRWGTPA